jgi:hypothetical protein
MEDVPLYHLLAKEGRTIGDAIQETIEFFEGMKIGIGITTSEDLERRLVQLRKAAGALSASSWS